MVELSKRAARDLERLPEALQSKAREVLKSIDEEPYKSTKLLGKLNGKWSTRLGRSHRIIYRIENGKVVVVTIGARRDVYRG